jgi:hypothetical protein
MSVLGVTCNDGTVEKTHAAPLPELSLAPPTMPVLPHDRIRKRAEMWASTARNAVVASSVHSRKCATHPCQGGEKRRWVLADTITMHQVETGKNQDSPAVP